MTLAFLGGLDNELKPFHGEVNNLKVRTTQLYISRPMYLKAFWVKSESTPNEVRSKSEYRRFPLAVPMHAPTSKRLWIGNLLPNRTTNHFNDLADELVNP